MVVLRHRLVALPVCGRDGMDIVGESGFQRAERAHFPPDPGLSSSPLATPP